MVPGVSITRGTRHGIEALRDLEPLEPETTL